jgi:hypothetical protein
MEGLCGSVVDGVIVRWKFSAVAQLVESFIDGRARL